MKLQPKNWLFENQVTIMKLIKILGRGFIDFHRGIFKMPILWRLWMVLLVAGNLVVPLFFVDRLESQVVLAAFVGSFLLMVVLTGFTGFTRLLGMKLVFWTPTVIFLFGRLGETPADDFFGIWLRALLAINIISLIIDASDVIRYIAGDRSDSLQVPVETELGHGNS